MIHSANSLGGQIPEPRSLMGRSRDSPPGSLKIVDFVEVIPLRGWHAPLLHSETEDFRHDSPLCSAADGTGILPYGKAGACEYKLRDLSCLRPR